LPVANPQFLIPKPALRQAGAAETPTGSAKEQQRKEVEELSALVAEIKLKINDAQDRSGKPHALAQTTPALAKSSNRGGTFTCWAEN